MELTTYFRFLVALLFVLALIVAAAYGLRRFGVGTPRGRRTRRLGIVEVTALDAKRRLVLIRRDNVEHLLLLGGPSDQVIETGIPAAQEAANS